MADVRWARIRGQFDAAAADFTGLRRCLWEPIGAAAVVVARPGAGDRVLDACCGTGTSAIPAARLVGRHGLVDAVDPSASMIDELWWLAKDLPQLRARQADVTTWTSGGYDLVQSALGILSFPDVVAGTEHLVGLARPGGRVVLTIWQDGAMAAAGRHLGRAVGEGVPAPPAGQTEGIDRADAYAKWLRARGLVDVEVTVSPLALAMTPDVAWLVIVGSGLREVLAEVPVSELDAVRERYLESMRGEGLTELDATTLIGSGRRP
ncbi:Methyltransferase domain-containing protein [Lentzea xinjiangensis]|uniref:Methyltransferase domain-containing protein n=1 Tax=Lentzea xinjiangensis TaxID=402600 RepID=A0A1H9SX10_9PSEU|nr:class I SAM-dependent methyltransferase [Lentzea xinjiangensis]SER88913.1 Methyltransferase domain-containing protein [Lentzea xinjiangensis]